MILMILYVAVLAAWLWPHGLGQSLRGMVFDSSKRLIPKLTAGRVLLAVFVLLTITALVAFARSDVLFFAAQALPEGVMWFATFDLAAYFDVIALAWLLAATVRWRGALTALWAWITRRRQGLVARRTSARARRVRRVVRKPPSKASDDDGGWAWA